MRYKRVRQIIAKALVSHEERAKQKSHNNVVQPTIKYSPQISSASYGA